MRFRLSMPLYLALLLTSNLFAQRGPAKPVGAPRLGRGPAHPGNKIVDRLSRMSPEERRRALKDLPPERQKRIEGRLEKYNSLPPEQRRRLHERYESFSQLPAEKKDQARRLFRKFSNLPEERRQLLRSELEHLREVPDAERRARINSDEFRNKYTLSEQQLVEDLTEILSPPPD